MIKVLNKRTNAGKQTLNKRTLCAITCVYEGGSIMWFERKAYDKLIEWKENYANEYAALL